jgi:peptidoglycan/LPS O-acetylase OafA/YrhL
MATVIAALVRGVSQLIAAATGLLLVFSLVYAMERMASRLPTTTARELIVATAFMLPWTLLFSSGFHDLSKATSREWVFWIGNALVLGFIYYYNRNTTEAELTKTAMPVVACACAVVPHVFRRTGFIYSVLCVLFAVCGVVVLYYATQTVLTPGRSFATPAIAAFLVAFGLSAISAGALTITSYIRRSSAR